MTSLLQALHPKADQWRARMRSETGRDDHGCWLWAGTITWQGYARATYGRRPLGEQLAHRLSYRLFNGSIPEGLQVDHTCRNRACVNPEHLEAVTASENVRRGLAATATHCKRNHPFDEQNTYISPAGHRNCRRCRREASRKIERRYRR